MAQRARLSVSSLRIQAPSTFACVCSSNTEQTLWRWQRAFLLLSTAV